MPSVGASVMNALLTRYAGLLRQFLKFGIVGGVGFLFDNALVYAGIYLLHMGHDAAGLASFPFVVSLTWVGNRYFTFREADRTNLAGQWLRFLSVCGVGLIFNRGTYSLMVHNFPLAYDYPVLALLAGTAAGMFFNFFVARRVVFR